MTLLHPACTIGGMDSPGDSWHLVCIQRTKTWFSEVIDKMGIRASSMTWKHWKQWKHWKLQKSPGQSPLSTWSIGQSSLSHKIWIILDQTGSCLSKHWRNSDILGRILRHRSSRESRWHDLGMNQTHRNAEKWYLHGESILPFVMIPHDSIYQFFILIFDHCSYMILVALPSETSS